MNIGVFLVLPVDCSSSAFFSFFVNGYYLSLVCSPELFLFVDQTCLVVNMSSLTFLNIVYHPVYCRTC
jgi:hypothetical protein